ncbi:MAG TPA: GIY-YIG nuclease family protein [Candidatus Paceibacterota bacterium]|nr:GIY-YIG nuclease family protein [Candidatus Paceibacterota bacterium]HQB57180.1 GIY-YIG nuclease family protein [Candidatus Paceibacterota bacterium]
MKKEDLKKNKLPETSGVYFFLDKKHIGKDIPNRKNVLYIGKATVLKDRVESYFSKDLVNTRGTRILSMIENAKSIFYLETKSVLEAIILESKYIKELQPFFNVKERDNKSYSYVVFTKEDFPKVLIMREREIEKLKDLKISKKFGPFVSKAELTEIMKFIRKIFPYRDKCKLNEKRGCFNYQIGLCPGVCLDLISKKDYAKNLKNIEKILSGGIEKLLKSLEKEMKAKAKEKKFEEAGKILEKIKTFNYLKDINLIKKESLNQEKLEGVRIESYDISHISGVNRVGVMCAFEDGELKKNEYKKFKLEEKVNNDLMGLVEVLERRFRHSEWKGPNILVIDGGQTHLSHIYEKLEKSLPKDILEKIIFSSVVKNEKHKAREVIALKNKEKKIVKQFEEEIIFLNEETHRFAINYHKFLRNKIRK